MKKSILTISKTSVVFTGLAVMMSSAMADTGNTGNYPANLPNGVYNGYHNYHNAPNTGYGTRPATLATTPANTSQPYPRGQYHHQPQGSYPQAHYPNRYTPVNNGYGRPQYHYQNAYPTRAAYPVYNRRVDYRYGYTARPQWYGRMHPHEYRVLRRDGRDFYYLEPAVYSTGVIVGRPQPGVVLMQYPDRTLEIIEATRLILDVMYRR